MKIYYFNELFFEDLEDNIEINYKHYISNKSWVDDIYKNKNYAIETNIEFKQPQLTNDDYNNAIKIYESLSELNLSQAAIPNLWSYLTHCVYYEYMTMRWPILGDNITKEMTTIIKERYFCKNTRRNLLRNGISRLWWATYLTYDNKEKYKYTKLLFSDEDLFIGLMERDYAMCKNIVIGVLKAIYDYIDKNGKLPTRNSRRALFIYINQIGAVTLLDSLKISDVERISLEFILNYLKYNN